MKFTWVMIEDEWWAPIGIRFFGLIVLFIVLWLPYLTVSHYLLFYKINAFSSRLRFKWRDEKNGFNPAAYIASISTKKGNRPIRSYFLTLAEKTTAPIEQRNPAAPRPWMEIDHFVVERALHLKSVAITAVFSLAGLILFCFYYAMRFLTRMLEIKRDPTLFDVIEEIHYVFGNTFPFLVIALAEAFLAFWLVNSVKKMRLRLDVIWAGFLEEIAGQ